MTVQLGKKIRELRKKRGISQEVLAQYLGVTFQAVSKWENGTAMPDVPLIPALASFFGVSTDELFDYNRLEAEKKVEEICWEASKFRQSDPPRSEAMLREGLKQFPGNEIILNNLLYTMSAPERGEEMIRICKTLIAETRDDSVKYDALRILADTYHVTGQQALVAPTLEQIPEIYFTKLQQMAMLLEGEASRQAAWQQMGLSLDETVDMLLVLRDREAERGDQAEADKYARLARGILEVFEREEGAKFAESSFYRWGRGILETLR